MAIYEFDQSFQTKVAALALRDATFNLRTDGLIEPGYFEQEAEGFLVDLSQRYWNKYRAVPSPTALVHLVKRASARKTLRSDMVDEVKDKLRELLKADVSDRDFVVDEVAEFARHQAIIAAMERSMEALEKRDFVTIETSMNKAMQVGVNEANEGSDYWQDIEARTKFRKDLVAGITIPAVTTGFRDLDDRLDGGFGRKELFVLLGPAKRGKSFGLMNFAVNASKAGYNVLYVTLENSLEITQKRMDAYVSQIKTNDILDHINAVEGAIKAKSGSTGILKVHEFGMGAFAPSDLRRLVENYRAKGIIFDEVVVDYWDIMAPDVIYRDDSIRESASIGKALRAIAKDEDLAMLTAVQSNREGFKSHTAEAQHVAEDFNKVRLADVMISINSDDDERANGEARLFFAAVRNNEGGYTLNIKQDLSKATFIAGFAGRAGI